MKLPFLKPMKSPGTIMVSTVDKKGDLKDDGVEGEHHPGLTAASEDLIQAVHAKDTNRVTEALKSFHDIHSLGSFDVAKDSE